MDQKKLETPFVITTVCGLDLQELGATEEQIAALTDADMMTIALYMGELYVEENFWFDLREAANKCLTQKGLSEIPVVDDQEGGEHATSAT